MSMEKKQTKTSPACGCPFCDQPACPEPSDGKYSCSTEGKLKIHRVDCVGLYCPVPVMRAKEEIDSLEPGNLMELIADDPASVEDIPRWAKRAGHQFISMRELDGEYFFLVQKGGAS